MAYLLESGIYDASIVAEVQLLSKPSYFGDYRYSGLAVGLRRIKMTVGQVTISVESSIQAIDGGRENGG